MSREKVPCRRGWSAVIFLMCAAAGPLAADQKLITAERLTEPAAAKEDQGEAPACTSCGCCSCQDCERSCGQSLYIEMDDGPGLFDQFTLLAALNGSKQPQDFGANAQLGTRFAFNWAIPIYEPAGLGFQIGNSVDPLQQAVGVYRQLGISDDRLQNFTTIALFQRTKSGLSWGFGHDFLYENYYSEVHLSQWRGLVAYRFREQDEVGSWFAIRDKGQTAYFVNEAVHLNAINQGSLYWRHWFANNTQTTLWVGMVDGHGTNIFIFPGNSTVSQRVLFGADLRVPLNEWAAIYGEANFIAPASSGTVDAYLGLEIYPRRNAQIASRSQFSPIYSVASNPTFAVDLRR